MLLTLEDLELDIMTRMESSSFTAHIILELDTLVLLEQLDHGLTLDMDLMDDTLEPKEHILMVECMVTQDLGQLVTQATWVDMAILVMEVITQDTFLETLRLRLMEEGTLAHQCASMGHQVAPAERADDDLSINLRYHNINLI